MTKSQIIRAIAAAVALVVLILIVVFSVSNPPQSNSAEVKDNQWTTEFLRGYERTLGDVNLETATKLIVNAEILCNYMNVEHTIPEAFEYGVDMLHMSSDQTATIIEGAIRTRCPQYEEALQQGADLNYVD